MANIKAVYDLVHSLNKREKIQISLFINNLSGKSKDTYAIVFQSISKQEEFDREKLLYTLKTKTKRKNISETNTNFYHFILSCLNYLHQNLDKKIGLLSHIQKAEILFSKGLIAQCLALIAKLKKQIEHSGIESLSIYLLDLESKALLRLGSKTYNERIALSEKQLQLNDTIRIKTEYQLLKKEFFKLVSNFGTPRKEEHLQAYKQLLKSPILLIDLDKVPLTLLTNFVQHKLFILSIDNNGKEVIKYGAKAYSFIKEKISIEKRFLDHYLICGILLEISIMSRLKKEAQLYMQEFLQLEQYIDSKVHQKLHKAKWINLQLMYFVFFRETEKGVLFIKENIANIENEALAKVYPNHYINYFYGAQLLFSAKDYNCSIDFLNNLIDNKKVRKPLLIHIDCLLLLNHYKLGNYDLLPYIVRATYNKLKKNKQLYAPEKALIQFLKKFENPFTQKQEIKKLYQYFLHLKDNPLHKSFFSNGDYLTWLKNELEE